MFDYEEPENNEFLAVNQFAVVEGRGETFFAPTRRPDVVLFINGLPIAVMELKNAATENATVWAAAFSTMAFYDGRVVLHPAMGNPTLVVITDRNDLDDQLFGTFARCHEWLRQQPTQAQSRGQLRELLNTASGGCRIYNGSQISSRCRGDPLWPPSFWADARRAGTLACAYVVGPPQHRRDR